MWVGSLRLQDIRPPPSCLTPFSCQHVRLPSAHQVPSSLPDTVRLPVLHCTGACLSEYQVTVAAEGQPPLTLSTPPLWDGLQSLPVTGLVNGARYSVSVVAKVG